LIRNKRRADDDHARYKHDAHEEGKPKPAGWGLVSAQIELPRRVMEPWISGESVVERECRKVGARRFQHVYAGAGHKECGVTIKAYLFNIFGTSLKKLDRSTSFFVAVQVILYENKCANMASESGIPRPPKKKKLVSNKLIPTAEAVKIRIHNSQEWYPHQIFQQSPYDALVA
jgi:hypothetical protein